MRDDELDPEELVEVRCYKCTLRFGITRRLYEIRSKDGVEFKCPVGHGNVYVKAENDPVKLRDRVTTLEAEVRQLKNDKAKLIHDLDQLRAKHGVEA